MSAPILITGVGKRLGLALARYFLSTGQPIIGTYRSEYPALQDLRAEGADLIACDFYQAAQVEGLLADIKARYSSLRGIIHNASDWMADKTAGYDDIDIFQRMMSVHAEVPYQINLAFEPLLRAYSGEMSDIIHITDYVATKGSKKHIAYAASKAALENMSLSFASAFAPAVKVNAIAPALMLFNDGDSQEYKAKTLAKTLIQHEGGEQEIIDTCAYLLASQYVTGRVLHLDGGRHLR